MNVLDMTISRVSRISMALSLILLASWVWFNFLTQPQTMNLFVSSPSMFQKISLGNLKLSGNDVLQNGFGVGDLQGSSSDILQLDSVEVIGNDSLKNGLSNGLGTSQLGESSVTNFSDAAVQGGPAPLLPSAQRQNIEIADLPFLVNAPPVDDFEDGEQIVIAAPANRLTVNPFAPIYVEEEEPQRRNPVVSTPPVNNTNTASNQRANQNSSSQTRAVAEPVEEVIQPKIEIGAVPTPRPLLPPPSRQSNLPASLATASVASSRAGNPANLANPGLLRAPIRSNYFDPSEVPEPVVVEIPAEVIEVPAVVVAEPEPEPVKLDRSRLTGIRLPVNGARASQAGSSQVTSRAYAGNSATSNASSENVNALPSVTQAPARPTIGVALSQRLPQSAGVRAAVSGTPALQPIGLKQAQLIGRRNVPVVEAPEPVEVVEEVVAPPVPQLRPVQIALRVPEPVVPVVQAPVIQEPVVQAPVEPVVQEPVVEEVIEEPVVEEVIEEPVVEEVIEEPVVEEVVEIPASQPYIATVSSTLDLAEPVVDTTTVQAVATNSAQTDVTPEDVAGASVVAEYVKDNNISFTGAILGPVSVAIFKSRIGSFHVPIGENIPDTDIRLTNVKRHEVELRQGSESHTIYLDLGQ